MWTLQEWSSGPVSVTALAERLGLRTSTVSDGVKKLVEAGFAEHEHYGGVTLTTVGRKHALAMVRRHRLIETYLVSALHYGWDEVHDEAEVLEHAVSDRFLGAIDALLDHPTRDPHGDPIPSADGNPHLPPAMLLAQCEPGTYTVARISDSDPERLRRFAAEGVTLDSALTVSDSGLIHLTGSDFALSTEDRNAVWVVKAQR